MATTFKAIATATLSSSTTAINFTGIPQTFTHLWVIGQVGTDYTTGTYMHIAPNNVTSSTYDYQTIFVGNGSITMRSGASSDKSVGLAEMVSATSTGCFLGFELIYPAYTSTSLGNNSWLYNVNGARTTTSTDYRGSWGTASNNETAAITSLNLYLDYSANFVAGSKITLYGLD